MRRRLLVLLLELGSLFQNDNSCEEKVCRFIFYQGTNADLHVAG